MVKHPICNTQWDMVSYSMIKNKTEEESFRYKCPTGWLWESWQVAMSNANIANERNVRIKLNKAQIEALRMSNLSKYGKPTHKELKSHPVL